MKGKRKGGWRERIMAGFPWCSEWEMTIISSVSEKLPKKRGKYICLSLFFFYNTLFFSPHLYNSTKSVKEIKFHFLEAFPNYSSPHSSFFNSSIVIVFWLKYHFTLFIGLTCVCFLFLNLMSSSQPLNMYIFCMPHPCGRVNCSANICDADFKVGPWSLSPGSHAFVQTPLLSVGSLWLAVKWEKGQGMITLTWLT